MAKILYVLRHAKAEAGFSNQADHSRRLVERGIEAAQITGAYLFRQQIKPEAVICSDAARARETWRQIEAIYSSPLNVEFTAQLYMASAGELFRYLSGLPDNINSALIIGHNPGLHQLCLMLAADGDEDILDAMHLKFPTCALAAINLGDISWHDIEQSTGKLIDFVTPKMLAGIVDD